MKKFLLVLTLIFAGMAVSAQEFADSSNNIWNNIGKKEQKVYNIGAKILYANKIQKRIVFYLNDSKTVNAFAAYDNKSVNINKGMLNYIDNDDELAAVISHEIAHNLDYNSGFGKAIAMNFNARPYEYKADIVGIDLMVKAGYNPIAMITIMNKISGERVFSLHHILRQHPATSKRLMNDYKHIYKNYPQYLSSDMTKNINYLNWVNTAQEDINQFKQESASKGKNNL